MTTAPSTLWFHSGSADAGLKSLSNFARVKGGHIVVPMQLGRTVVDTRFGTVEAAFQACKLRVCVPPCPSKSSEHEEAVRKLVSDLQDAPTGGAAKRLGTAKEFTARGLKLNVAAWDAISRPVMRWLLAQRAVVDADFRRKVLELSCAHSDTPVQLLHFARGLHYVSKETGERVVKRDKTGNFKPAALNASLLGDDMVEVAKAVAEAPDASVVLAEEKARITGWLLRVTPRAV